MEVLLSDFLERGLECEGCHDEAEVLKFLLLDALQCAIQAELLLGNEKRRQREGREDAADQHAARCSEHGRGVQRRRHGERYTRGRGDA